MICISEVVDILPAILIPACASTSPAFLMMYSANKLNKKGDNILMNSMKRQKDVTLRDEPPRSMGIQYTTGEEQKKKKGTKILFA